MLTSDAGKPLQELCDRRAAFEILEQCMDRHSRALEYPGPTDLPGIPFDRRALGPIEHDDRMTGSHPVPQAILTPPTRPALPVTAFLKADAMASDVANRA